jgi:hypothetical protein
MLTFAPPKRETNYLIYLFREMRIFFRLTESKYSPKKAKSFS